MAWSPRSKTSLIRIPERKGENTRIELRSPDPSCNPYLTLAVCLAAGLDGIKRQILPPPNVDKNLFSMSEQEREELGIAPLPRNLDESLLALESDELLMEVLGERAGKRYVLEKKQEWAQYSAQVSDWEISQYLYRI